MRRFDYYDKILGAIGTSLVVGLLLGGLTAIAFHVGVFVGAVAATVFVLDAILRNPPVPVSDPRLAAPAIVWHSFVVLLAMFVFL